MENLDLVTPTPEAFFRMHYPAVFRFVASASGAGLEEVEDIVQETLLSAWRDLARYRAEAASLTWIIAIARHRVADFFRRRTSQETQRARLREAIERLDSAVMPAEAADSPELKRLLRQVLEELPADYADALRLKYFEGRSLQSMAEALGTSIHAVDARLRRARRELHDRLSQRIKTDE